METPTSTRRRFSKQENFAKSLLKTPKSTSTPKSASKPRQEGGTPQGWVVRSPAADSVRKIEKFSSKVSKSLLGINVHEQQGSDFSSKENLNKSAIVAVSPSRKSPRLNKSTVVPASQCIVSPNRNSDRLNNSRYQSHDHSVLNSTSQQLNSPKTSKNVSQTPEKQKVQSLPRISTRKSPRLSEQSTNPSEHVDKNITCDSPIMSSTTAGSQVSSAVTTSERKQRSSKRHLSSTSGGESPLRKRTITSVSLQRPVNSVSPQQPVTSVSPQRPLNSVSPQHSKSMCIETNKDCVKTRISTMLSKSLTSHDITPAIMEEHKTSALESCHLDSGNVNNVCTPVKAESTNSKSSDLTSPSLAPPASHSPFKSPSSRPKLTNKKLQAKRRSSFAPERSLCLTPDKSLSIGNISTIF